MKNGHLFTYLRKKNNLTNHTILYMGDHKIELTDLTNFQDFNVTETAFISLDLANELQRGPIPACANVIYLS